MRRARYRPPGCSPPPGRSNLTATLPGRRRRADRLADGGLPVVRRDDRCRAVHEGPLDLLVREREPLVLAEPALLVPGVTLGRIAPGDRGVGELDRVVVDQQPSRRPQVELEQAQGEVLVLDERL